jgi:hypothetical protein
MPRFAVHTTELVTQYVTFYVEANDEDEALTNAFHRYNKSKKNTPKSRVTYTGIGPTRTVYEQMLPGMIVRMNGVEIVRP